jgi:hypothetical protein
MFAGGKMFAGGVAQDNVTDGTEVVAIVTDGLETPTEANPLAPPPPPAEA